MTEEEKKELLREAAKRYPIGTMYKPIYPNGNDYDSGGCGGYFTAVCAPRWLGEGIEVGYGYVFGAEKGEHWAETEVPYPVSEAYQVF